MIKNKFKVFIFSLFAMLFCCFFNSEVKALAYNANVTSIEGLIYGNSYKSASIQGTSDISGNFVFITPDAKAENINNTVIQVRFEPIDTLNYEAKVFDVNTSIGKRRIYPVFETLIRKQYDGKNEIQLPTFYYQGILNGEVEVEGTLVATLLTTYVNENTPITFSGVSIVGDKKDYYYLDLENYSAIVSPSVLEKSGENETSIELAKDVYVDVNYKLKVNKYEENKKVNNSYTSFLEYSYEVYGYTGDKKDIDSTYKVTMAIDESIMNNKRIMVYEYDGKEYKKLEYTYSNGKITFTMNSNSKVVFALKNIEYHLIAIFGGILLFSLCFIIITYIKNSKIKVKETGEV